MESAFAVAPKSVRKKRDEWEQINITAFAKKMNGLATLKAEKCSECYHQGQTRRNGSDVYLHPLRVLKIFIYYSVYRYGMVYDDEAGASVLLHDTIEDVSKKILLEINENYGLPTSDYVKAVSRLDNESISRYLARVFRWDTTAFMKLCDHLDNLLGMLEEYYDNNPSATRKRLKKHLAKKVQPFIERMEKISFSEMKYRRPISEALEDLKNTISRGQKGSRILKLDD